jgi:hypothetical protein
VHRSWNSFTPSTHRCGCHTKAAGPLQAGGSSLLGTLGLPCWQEHAHTQ